MVKGQKSGGSIIGFIIGLLMIALGGFVWMHPVDALVGLAIYLGIIFIVAGVGHLAAFFSGWSGVHVALAILDLFIGILFVTNLGISALSLPFIVGLWVLFTGIIQILAALQSRVTESTFWLWTLVSGILGVLFAILIIYNPVIGMYTITVLLGTYLVLYGILTVAEALSDR
ncbi:MAG: DUF308 domain-containing protein [Lactobacillales bacterium]|jgi:uncharacterized membrane protein HdeD (DUF308 family)|nr:DUF308 domain-containing protein [Lactobacillales bacterium]